MKHNSAYNYSVEKFLTNKQRYQPISLPENFSDEEMVRDWSLTVSDIVYLEKYRTDFRLNIAVQLCSIKLYGRFLNNVNDLSPRIISYLIKQLNLQPLLTIESPEREATLYEQRKSLLQYLGFRKFDDKAKADLNNWLSDQASKGYLPTQVYTRAERHLLLNRVVLPGPIILERIVIRACTAIHSKLFKHIANHLSSELKDEIDQLLIADTDKKTMFHRLKKYPPSASIKSLNKYIERYQLLDSLNLPTISKQSVDQMYSAYLYGLAKKYHAKEVKRFNDDKRYSMMLCFLVEQKKVILDYLVNLHDQYIVEMLRKSKRKYEKQHKACRKRHKKAIDTVITSTNVLLGWPDDKPLFKSELWATVSKDNLLSSLATLEEYKELEEQGVSQQIIRKYPSLRKYFAKFIYLPFATKSKENSIYVAIDIVRKLDDKTLRKLPDNTPVDFVPHDLRACLRDDNEQINRNAWEMGLAIALKDKLRSGDLYLPQSKEHVSFWDMMISDKQWQESRESSYEALQQPYSDEVKNILCKEFHSSVEKASTKFNLDDFAQIDNRKLKLKKYDKSDIPDKVIHLQKTIDSSMPIIRIEQLLMEVDKLTNFSRHFVPIQKHNSRPQNFYKTLIAALISQATNLGVVAMSASVQGVTVDMLRHVLQFYVHEESLKMASAEIVNHHHQLPLSGIHGSGSISSSDAQRFKIRADSLLASYYPRYYGYYEKAVGIYTHVSDQYSVYNTQVISCSPREALYVLDGLLENNTILQVKEHTTDTHGYTEIIFALCYLLGYYFMPRLKDLPDQQLYRTVKEENSSVFSPILNKTADLDIIEEQWESMIRVAQSLKEKTTPAHIVVQRLTNSSPADSLSKAFTNLGRIIKTQYILTYITDLELRRKVQLQLNKGEYRHKLPRWIFFANQGEFTTGDYEEIMNKSSCLSLVSNAILHWNTIKIGETVNKLSAQGESVPEDVLSHVSLLPFKHVLPNGMYFSGQ